MKTFQRFSVLALLIALAMPVTPVMAGEKTSLPKQDQVPTVPAVPKEKDVKKETPQEIPADPSSEFFAEASLSKVSASKETVVYEQAIGEGGQRVRLIESPADKKGVSKLTAVIQVPDAKVKGGYRTVETFNVADYEIVDYPEQIFPDGGGAPGYRGLYIDTKEGYQVAIISHEKPQFTDVYSVFGQTKLSVNSYAFGKSYFENGSGFTPDSESVLSASTAIGLFHFYDYDDVTGKKTEEKTLWFDAMVSDGKINGKEITLTKNFAPDGSFTQTVRIDTGFPDETVLYESLLTDVKIKSTIVNGISYFTEFSGVQPDGKKVKITITFVDIKVKIG